jgi:cation transport ATPase
MKKLIFLFITLFPCIAVAGQPGNTITKEDILKTVQHMRELTAEAQKETSDAKHELANVQVQSDLLAKTAAEEKAKADREHAAAHENAKERDVVLYLWALVMAAYAGTFFAAPLSKLAEPYGLIAVIAAYVASFGAGYGIGRLILSSLAHFIP